MAEYSLNTLKKEWVTTKGIALEDFLVLTLYVTKSDRTAFYRETEIFLTAAQYQELVTLLERRAKQEPVAYLTGTKEFFGRDFLVNSSTLIPRPDSECLIEDVLRFYQEHTVKPKYIFDIGTGSGALAITLCKELANQTVTVLANDISLEALAMAKQNAHKHTADVTFFAGSFLAPYQSFLSSQEPLYIVANLPYVSAELLKEAAPDVKNYEPVSALLSAEQGLAHYQALLKEIKVHVPGLKATCWLEISPEQSDFLTKELQSLFPGTEIFIGQDLAQQNRFLRFTL